MMAMASQSAALLQRLLPPGPGSTHGEVPKRDRGVECGPGG